MTNGNMEHQRINGQKKTRKSAATGSRDRIARIEARDSLVHGRGVFAIAPIRKGSRIIEYTGKRMSWEEASGDSDDPRTFLFGLEDKDEVINAAIGGNESRWINHSCEPNCEAIEEDGRVFIYALRNLLPGEELLYDYGLKLDEPRTKELEEEHECRCGALRCRGTLLAPVND